MRYLPLIVLLACVCACSSPSANIEETDPFGDAEPVNGGLYSELPAETAPVTWAPIRLLEDEWAQSVAGWSFTTRAIGRWAKGDWDRLFGPTK